MSRSRFRLAGFTLIEMLVVLVIIATIAGLAIPMVSSLGRTSDMAATAKTQGDLAQNLQMFFLLQKRFPQGLDSLIEIGGTTLYGPDTTLESTQTTGLPVSGPSLYADLTVQDLTNATNAEYLRSFSRAGFDWVYDHDRATINSNLSSGPAITTSQRLVSGSTFKVAQVTDSSVVAKRLLPSSNGVIPANSKIVALGIGASNSAVGKTLTQATIYPGCDGRYYGRYVAFFQVFATGERAVLVGVTDSYGRSPDYSIQQFNESLPNGSRQG